MDHTYGDDIQPIKKILLLLSLLSATNAWAEEDSTFLLCKSVNNFYGIELFNNSTEARYIGGGTGEYDHENWIYPNWATSDNVKSNGYYSIEIFWSDKKQRRLDINRTDLSMKDITITWKVRVLPKVRIYQCETSSSQALEEIFSAMRIEVKERRDRQEEQKEKEKKEREKKYKI